MGLQFTASEIHSMRLHFTLNNFEQLLKVANISWDLQDPRKPTIDEVYHSDAVFCEELQVLEHHLFDGAENKDFCLMAIEYLESRSIRSTIIFSEIKSNELNSFVMC